MDVNNIGLSTDDIDDIIQEAEVLTCQDIDEPSDSEVSDCEDLDDWEDGQDCEG